MKHTIYFFISLLIVLTLSGCANNATTDIDNDAVNSLDEEYLSLNDLLTTERSPENLTDDETVPDDDKLAKEDETATDKSSADKVNSSKNESSNDKDDTSKNKTSDDNNSEEHMASADDASNNIDKNSEPETVIVYKYIEVPVPSQPYFFSDTYHTGGADLVFSPREIYYRDGKLYATMYIYNGHNTVVSNIREVYLSFDNGITAIASASFDTLSGCSIAPGSYVLWSFTFPADAVYLKNDFLSVINTTYRSTYTH